jgi:hypothetical protein
VSVKIPANTSATIVLPVSFASKVLANGKSLSENKEFTGIAEANKKLTFTSGSGDYVFEYTEE